MKEWIKTLKIEHVIAILVIVLTFSYLFYVTSIEFTKDKETMIYGIVTGLLPVLTGVTAYYYGKSKGGNNDSKTSETSETSTK